ncbi:unnamed protein product [Closterium sp. Naga37s-1]|nr:unnamed protein product [Closterium sp. Naga37s-1]
MGGKWGAISKLHAFPKAEDHLTQKTLSGAIVTLLGGAIMVLLLAHELSSVLTPEHSGAAGRSAARPSHWQTSPPSPPFPPFSPSPRPPPSPLLPLTALLHEFFFMLTARGDPTSAQSTPSNRSVTTHPSIPSTPLSPLSDPTVTLLGVAIMVVLLRSRALVCAHA